MLVQVMMQVTMLMQAIGDGGICDITSPSKDESHKERPWVYSDIKCENPSLLPWHLISFRLIPTYVH